MKKYYFFSLFIALSFLASCQNRNEAKAMSGASVGTDASYATGSKTNDPAMSGTVIGAALDDQDRKIMNKTSPRTVERMDKGEPLTVGDVIKLSQGGISDDIIINYITESKTTYNLTQAQVNRMQEAGVSQRIINFMVDTGQ
jgi:hypothetical protein